MQSAIVSSLHIDQGTCFGYRSGPFWNRKESRLVEVNAPVVVGPGLHLFVAPNGTGKTTLLRTLAGLNGALAGKLRVGGTILYLSDELRTDPELKSKTLFRAMFTGRTLVRAIELADTLKLDLSTPIGKLSRGNRQKVLLIMAETKLCESGGNVVLMDEPLTGLDAETRELVVSLWAGACTHSLRLVVLHELESVRDADSLFTIKLGKLYHAQERAADCWMETYKALQK